MSAADIDVGDLSPDAQDFVLDAATTASLSIGTNDAGELVVSCHNHDDHATVSMTAVFALAAEYGLRVVDGTAHWDGETVELVVADGGGWQSGDGSDGS